MRVPPEAGAAMSGSRSLVARRTAAAIRVAAARPMDPPRNPNSLTTTAAGPPRTSSRPVSTASSVRSG
jgi:hypothetical protein